MSYTAFYNRLEQLLSELLKSLDEMLSKSEKQEVIDFIQHGEYGIALETLCVILKEKDKNVKDHNLKQIRDLQEIMQIQSLPIDE